MAKKTTPKKKAAPVKAKAAVMLKSSKAPKQQVKTVMKSAAKSAVKAVKTLAKILKPNKVSKVVERPTKVAAASKPAMMTKKGKMAANVEASEPVAKLNKSVISIMEEAPATDEPQKAEKTSKVKSVKVDRGNLNDEKAKWSELNKKYSKDKALVYKMTEIYPALVPLQHKVLGWGFILTNDNNRLEVLFETGIRILISNYKS